MALKEQRYSGSMAQQIIEEVAECHGVDPDKIDANLEDRVNPDSLDSLWSGTPKDSFGVVSFAFYGCRVTVTEDGDIDASLHVPG